MFSPEFEGQLVRWRREFHQQPELGFHEFQTAARITQILGDLGLRVRSGVGRTGVVGELGGGSPVIAIRADMDALPIQEENQVPYASQIPGVMHACGHDAHMAIVLGVASQLAKEELPGTLRFIFQPAEEVGDEEGISGAPRMIAEGVMEGVRMVLALHADATTAYGKIRVGAGPASGGVDTFFATILGKGGHGARPHESVDPFFITGHIILALNGIVSRRIDPFHPAVVSIGSLCGGHASNVIPERVEMSGTLRYMQPEVQQKIHDELERAFEIARNLGGDYELKIEIGSPPMINHPEAVELIRDTASALIGAEHVLPPANGLGAEDFGCFTRLAPGAMFQLGCRLEDEPRYHHHPRFDIDERCLPTGVAILSQAARRFLSQERKATSLPAT